MVFQPEVNDEVLVGFEGGDPRQPVVLGGLFSGKNALPEWGVKSGAVQSRRITSRLGPRHRAGRRHRPGNQHVLAAVEHHHAQDPARCGQAARSRWPAASRCPIKSGSASLEIEPDGTSRSRARRSTHQGADRTGARAATRRSRSPVRDSWPCRADGRGQGSGYDERGGERTAHPQGCDGGDQLMNDYSPTRRADLAQSDGSFVGRGFFWPMEVDHTGSIRLTDGAEDIDRRCAWCCRPRPASGDAAASSVAASGICCSSRSPPTCSA